VRQARTIPRLTSDSDSKRETYLERRRERQRLETLLEKASAKERNERERRIRAEMDDLFQIRRRFSLDSATDTR
jgi:flagellar export protein FliJ